MKPQVVSTTAAGACTLTWRDVQVPAGFICVLVNGTLTAVPKSPKQ